MALTDKEKQKLTRALRRIVEREDFISLFIDWIGEPKVKQLLQKATALMVADLMSLKANIAQVVNKEIDKKKAEVDELIDNWNN